MNPSDTTWLLVCAALVLLMTPGLALFYSGLARSKNAAATVVQCLMSMGIVGIVWVLWGYTLAFGPDVGKFIGSLEFLGLNNVSATEPGPHADNVPHQAHMIFQGMFAIIAPALIAGAFAERMKFICAVRRAVGHDRVRPCRPLGLGRWMDPGAGRARLRGRQRGPHQHRGSRSGRRLDIWPAYRLWRGADGAAQHSHGGAGGRALWFGWFGFNAGSALAIGGSAVNAFVVTNTAAAAGILGWTTAAWVKHKPSVVGAASGAVAGLVAITPAAGYVGPMPAILIGLVAGVLCYLAVELLLKLKLDDSLSVWGLHGVGGTWGALATGLFVGIGFGGIEVFTGVSRIEQIGIQVLAILATWGWAFVATGLILWFLKITIGIRVPREVERAGLDASEHGESAYRL